MTYTVAVTNHGPDAATGVGVQDDLPAGLSFVSATTASGSYDPVSGLWAIGAVTAGETVTLQIVARVTQAGDITNVATIGHADQFDPDPANNAASAVLTASEAPGPAPVTPPPTTSAPGLPNTGAPSAARGSEGGSPGRQPAEARAPAAGSPGAGRCARPLATTSAAPPASKLT